MRETEYQRKLVKKLERLFPDCVVIKNNPAHRQGIPDLVILYKEYWAALEVKVSLKADVHPNQEYYVSKFDDMSFAAFICPENEQAVLDELQHAFGHSRKTRVS